MQSTNRVFDYDVEDVEYKTFIADTRIFQQDENVQVNVIHHPIKKINKDFLQDPVKYQLSELVKKCFSKNSSFSTDVNFHENYDKHWNKYIFYYIFKLYEIIKSGNKLQGPLNAHYFGKGNVSVYPDRPYLFFEDVYREKIYCVVNDFKGDLHTEYEFDIVNFQDSKIFTGKVGLERRHIHNHEEMSRLAKTTDTKSMQTRILQNEITIMNDTNQVDYKFEMKDDKIFVNENLFLFSDHLSSIFFPVKDDEQKEVPFKEWNFAL